MAVILTKNLFIKSLLCIVLVMRGYEDHRDAPQVSYNPPGQRVHKVILNMTS